MAKKGLPTSKASKEYHSFNTTDLCSFANGINTGVPALNQPSATPPVSPVVTMATLKAKALSLFNIHSGRQTSPPTTTALQEDTAKTDLLHNLDKLVNQADSVAEDATIAAGDVSVGNAILTSIGLKLAGKGGGHPHTFKQLKSAKNSVLVQFPSAGRGGIISVRCEITTEGVIPATWGPTISISIAELLISGGGLKTGQILAIQYGYTLHTATGTGAGTISASETGRAISSTSTKSTKKKKQTPVYTYGSDPINWSPHILFALVQ